MITMELIDTWIPHYVAWWAPYVLLFCIPALLAWFPGANARQRGHERAQTVSTTSWLLLVTMSSVLMCSDYDVLSLMPSFTMLWVALAVWSYGRHEHSLATARGRGFEIISIPPLNFGLELAAAE